MKDLLEDLSDDPSLRDLSTLSPHSTRGTLHPFLDGRHITLKSYNVPDPSNIALSKTGGTRKKQRAGELFPSKEGRPGRGKERVSPEWTWLGTNPYIQTFQRLSEVG